MAYKRIDVTVEVDMSDFTDDELIAELRHRKTYKCTSAERALAAFDEFQDGLEGVEIALRRDDAGPVMEWARRVVRATWPKSHFKEIALVAPMASVMEGQTSDA